MSLFNKKVAQITPRLYKGGWQNIGKISRESDNRTIAQLKESFDAYANEIPSIKQFSQDVKNLNLKHLGTVVDVLELSSNSELIFGGSIDLKKNIEQIIKELIKASKENPEAMTLIDSIINNTDTTTSKYAILRMLGGFLHIKEASNHMKETAKIVPNIAEETLKGGLLYGFEKQENFMQYLFRFIHPKTKTEKIDSVFKDLVPFCNKRAENFEINLSDYLESSVPNETIKENLETLPNILDNGNFKNFDLISFLLKNKNLK